MTGCLRGGRRLGWRKAHAAPSGSIVDRQAAVVAKLWLVAVYVVPEGWFVIETFIMGDMLGERHEGSGYTTNTIWALALVEW
jgi:hypothetical protein